VELQHLYRVAVVEVEDLVRVENVHLRECAGFEKVVDGRGGWAHSAREIERRFAAVCSAVEAAFNRVRFEAEQRLDPLGGQFWGGHEERIAAGGRIHDVLSLRFGIPGAVS